MTRVYLEIANCILLCKMHLGSHKNFKILAILSQFFSDYRTSRISSHFVYRIVIFYKKVTFIFPHLFYLTELATIWLHTRVVSGCCEERSAVMSSLYLAAERIFFVIITHFVFTQRKTLSFSYTYGPHKS